MQYSSAAFEKVRYSAPHKPILLTARQMEDDVVQMNQRWSLRDFSGFGPLEFKGYAWLEEISQAFIEVVRKAPDSDDAKSLMTMKYVLTEEGSTEVPRSVGDIKLAELMPRESLGSAAEVVIDFFDSNGFMSIVRCAMISTAVTRFQTAVNFIV
ncbi:uncharacterized protein V1513DRAFT_424603 [Lipomyces chichibuensis]|uniref:uncharacterized protein n=1 Tax=Lipomyces chichibuensis TaxID=1546026 RepID=UPI003343EB5C